MTLGRYTGVKSVDVACRILKVFSTRGPDLALKDLADGTRIPASKIHRYLDSMVRGGLVEQNPGTRRYSLGRIAFDIGLRAIASHDPLQDAIRVQAALRSAIDQTAALSVWGNEGPVIVHVAESSQPVIMTMKVGAVLPILATATGLVFSAHMPPVITRPLIERALASPGPHSPIVHDRKALKAVLAEVRSNGYAINKGHLTPGVCAIAVPFMDHQNQLTSVIAVMAHEGDVEIHKNRIVDFVRGSCPGRIPD